MHLNIFGLYQVVRDPWRLEPYKQWNDFMGHGSQTALELVAQKKLQYFLG